MVELDIGRMRNSSVGYLYARRGEIDMSPSYQRQGAIWSVDKQQLLIDSLVNGFDVPKIYLHQFATPREVNGRKLRYALVDGKQRLEAIFGFLEGDFALGEGFEYFEDPSTTVRGLTYSELSESYPDIVGILNATVLDVVTIRTDDIELIEEMFSRLNEAVPLNAAEKRNALGGPCPGAVRELSEHGFFVDSVPFNNSRYRHFDLAAKFLVWQDHRLQPEAGQSEDSVRDVKKYRLDRFFRDMKSAPDGGARVEADALAVREVLEELSGTFIDKDPLLSSVGMVSLYFLLSGKRRAAGRRYPPRRQLAEFEQARRVNRVPDEDDLRPGQYQLIEFDRLAQSPNDGSALARRLTILDTYLTAVEQKVDPIEALGASFGDSR